MPSEHEVIPQASEAAHAAEAAVNHLNSTGQLVSQLDCEFRKVAEDVTKMTCNVISSAGHAVEATSHAAEHVGSVTDQAIAWFLIAQFALFPVYFVVLRLLRAKGPKKRGKCTKLTLREKFTLDRAKAQLALLIPSEIEIFGIRGDGEWAGVGLHTVTVAVMGVSEILTGTLTPLEAVAGIGTLGLLASLLVRFHEFSVRIEEQDRILIQYGAVIGFGCVSAILIAHIHAGDKEVGLAIFTGAQMAIAGLVGYNHFSGGSRGVRKAISVLAHFVVEINRGLATLEMQQAPEFADHIRKYLTNRWFKPALSEWKQAVRFLKQNWKANAATIGLTRKQYFVLVNDWDEEFCAGVEKYRLGEHGPLVEHEEEEGAKPIGG